MYNQYLQNNPPSSFSTPSEQSEHSVCSDSIPSSNGNLLGNLFGGGSLSNLLDDNTWLVFVILYFLLHDDDNGVDRDLLLIAGVFLLLGL